MDEVLANTSRLGLVEWLDSCYRRGEEGRGFSRGYELSLREVWVSHRPIAPMTDELGKGKMKDVVDGPTWPLLKANVGAK